MLASATMSPPDPEHAARRALLRTRLLANLLLLLMAALVAASYALPPGRGAALLRACAAAGLVGGVADWFAVTALFRRPFGLPIPHTAIIPAQKARLGAALGRFVASAVVTPPEVARTLARLDVAGFLHRFLSDPETVRPMARSIAAALPALLDRVEDGRARRLLARLLPRLLGGAAGGRVMARALRGLVEGGRHQEVLGFLLEQVRVLVASREAHLRTLIEERVREQGGRLLGWAVGASIASRVLTAIGAELDKVGPDDSELRAAFDEWVRREITRMEEDPEHAAAVGRTLRGVLAHETVQAWVWDVWARTRRGVEADLQRPDGRAAAWLEASLLQLADQLTGDPRARDRLQHAAERLALRALPGVQAHLSTFIASVVAGWDARTVTERLELRVGRDLQFVRVNGTVVGFLAGGVLALLLGALGP